MSRIDDERRLRLTIALSEIERCKKDSPMASRDRHSGVSPVAPAPSPPRPVIDGERKFGTMAAPHCPKCGGQMVLRTSWGARIGTSFWGCSRYPRCCSTITTS